MHALVERLKKFADRGWYGPLVALLAGVDQFVVILPIEWLMVPNIMVRPGRWLRSALWVTTGSALGATALAALAYYYGPAIIERWAPDVVHTSTWARSIGFIKDYGIWALTLVAASPIPQQPAVALAGLSHFPLAKIFAAIWAGRAIKYCLLAYLVSHAPSMLGKVFPRGKAIQHEVEEFKG